MNSVELDDLTKVLDVRNEYNPLSVPTLHK
jgi:hypothetical protein